MAKKEKKSILEKAIDAVSTRDEKEAAEEAKKEAEAAKRQAALEAAKRQAAEAKVRAAEAKAKKAEEAAAQAKAKVEAAERTARFREMQERVAEARELAAAKKRVYVVQSGDSLSKIAKEELGDAGRWPEIFELNKDKIKDPNLIHPGQELKMPS
jgi:nucleoid-associated protein YgaU